MKNKILQAVLLITFIFVCNVQSQPELKYANELQSVLDKMRQAANIRGVSAAVVVPGYKPWLGVSGESFPGQPMTSDMVFDMASTGKFVMSALMLNLCEEGLISLDDPISKYLPEYPNVDGSITIAQCLNHTSGLYDIVPHPGGPFRVPYNSIEFDKWWTIDEIFTKLGGKPYFKPGEGFHYTQAGYQLAFLIVEKVAKSTVAEEIQKRLLDPLKINGMLLDFTKPIPEKFKIAHQWVDTDSDGTPEDVTDRSKNWIASLSRIMFYSSPGDLAVLANAIFNGKILQAQSLDKMLTFVHPKKNETDKPLFSDYGLGVMEINPELMRGQRTLGHLGSIPGYRTFLGHLADYNITFVIMYNSDTDEGFPIIDGLLVTILSNVK